MTPEHREAEGRDEEAARLRRLEEILSSPWTAGLDLPLVSNNDPDPRLVWVDSLLVADFRMSFIDHRSSAALAQHVVELHNQSLAPSEALRTCRKERDEARAEVERLREAIRQANGTLWCVRNNVGCSTIETAEQMLDDALLPSPPSAKEAGA